MKTATAGLQAFLFDPVTALANPQIILVDLFTVTLLDGTILYLTSFDQPITLGGNVFVASGPFLKRGKILTKLGLSVSEMDLVVTADPSHHVEGIPILQAIQQGMFDGAAVLVQRGYNGTDVSLGVVTDFIGTVADVTEASRTHARLKVRSPTELLNVMMPRNLLQPGCYHQLFDAGCTLHASDFTSSGTVASGSTKITVKSNLTKPGPQAPPAAAPTLSQTSPAGINLPATTYYVAITYINGLGESIASPEASRAVPVNSLLGVASPPAFAGATGWVCYVGTAPGDEQRQGASISIGTAYVMPATGAVQGANPPNLPTGGYFTLGVIKFTSGLNNKQSRVVSQYFGSGDVVVVPGLPYVPAAGDTFTITPGCDKQQGTCLSKFSNLLHFGGIPYAPQPEQVL